MLLKEFYERNQNQVGEEDQLKDGRALETGSSLAEI